MNLAPVLSYVAGRLAPQSNHVAVQFKQNQEMSPFSGGEDYQFWIDFLREVRTAHFFIKFGSWFSIL